MREKINDLTKFGLTKCLEEITNLPQELDVVTQGNGRLSPKCKKRQLSPKIN